VHVGPALVHQLALAMALAWFAIVLELEMMHEMMLVLVLESTLMLKQQMSD